MFKKFKDIILSAARKSEACENEYKKALISRDFKELFSVIKNNFAYCCTNNIINEGLFHDFGDILEEYEIFYNTAAEKGYTLVDTKKAYTFTGKATVVVLNSEEIICTDTVIAYAFGGYVTLKGSAIGRGYRKAFFRAHEYSIVELDDVAHVILYNNAKAYLEGKSSVRALDSSSAILRNFATATALNESVITAKDYSTVFAKNTSKVDLYNYARALMYDNSRAKAQENSVVYDNRDNSNNLILENATQIKY